MLSTTPYEFVLSAIVLVSLLLPFSLIITVFKKRAKDRITTLEFELLNNPAQSLRDAMLDQSTIFIRSISFIPLVLLLLGVNFIIYLIVRPGESIVILAIVSILLLVGVTYFLVNRARKAASVMRELKSNSECKEAVAQELSKLLPLGFKVYHDFSAEKFQIDHIAIGPTGVFAIETVYRPQSIAESENRIVFDGKTLEFPSWNEDEPVDKVKKQAEWLSRWIESASGVPQSVIPVLAFPGWQVVRTEASDVRVYGGDNPEQMVEGKDMLLDARIQELTHRIESRVKQLHPEAGK